MDKRKLIASGGLLLAVVIFLQNKGWIDITNIVGPQPTPPVVVPDDTDTDDEVDPIPPVNVNPNSDLLIAIEKEGFPSLPPEMIDVSLPIKESLIRCNDPNKALLVARAYADWDTVMRLAWTPTQLKTYSQFREKHSNAIKGMLAKHQLSSLCIGFGPLVDQVITSQTGPPGVNDTIPPDVYEKIARAFQAVSARAYEAFQELVK